MNNLTIYIIILWISCCFDLIAQDILWEKSHGGIHSEYLFDAVATPDYGFILAGSSLSGKSGNKIQESQGSFDYWIWKMDEHGEPDWQQSFGGAGADHLKSIQTTRDGGYILAGTSQSDQGGDKKEKAVGTQDLWIIKLDAQGGETWQKTIGSKGYDEVKVIRQVADGGYIIGGSSNGSASGDKTTPNYGGVDYWIIKIDAAGAIVWQKTYGGQFTDSLESLEPTKDEGFIVGGWSNSPKSGTKEQSGFGEGDFWILKLDKAGDIQWQKTIGGEQDDHLQVIFETSQGGFIAAGNSRSAMGSLKTVSNGRGTDFWVLQLTENGEIEWQKTYDFGQNDLLTAITQNKDGSFLIAGQAKTENTGRSQADKKGINDYIVLKIDAEGAEIRRQTIGSAGEETLRKLIETRDGGYILAGTSRGMSSRDKNTHQGNSDFWTVKLRDQDKPVKERHQGLEAFPNPTEGFTNIVVNHEYEEGTLTVYDISGRRLQRIPITSKMIPLNMNTRATGVYIVSVKTNVTTETIKIIKGN